MAKQLFCSRRQSCLPRRQCIARGESTDHLPLCRYSKNTTGTFYHCVHRKKKTGRKVKVSKREEMGKKYHCYEHCNRPMKILDSTLIKGTQINGSSLKAALRAFDPKLKLYKSSFAPALTTVKESSEQYKEFFQSEKYGRIKPYFSTLIE